MRGRDCACADDEAPEEEEESAEPVLPFKEEDAEGDEDADVLDLFLAGLSSLSPPSAPSLRPSTSKSGPAERALLPLESLELEAEVELTKTGGSTPA